jgi:hypothetical protein
MSKWLPAYPSESDKYSKLEADLWFADRIGSSQFLNHRQISNGTNESNPIGQVQDGPYPGILNFRRKIRVPLPDTAKKPYPTRNLPAPALRSNSS